MLSNNCFLYTYYNEIIPVLESIDLYIKSSEPVTIVKSSRLLNMTAEEFSMEMKRNNIKKLDIDSFIYIMLHSNTYICGLLRRQLECGVKEKYSPEDISYIYNLSLEKTKNAFGFLGLDKADSKALPLIFLQIRNDQ